mgnify:CR=1 FL=1
MILNGSQIVIECLKEQGVDTVFGLGTAGSKIDLFRLCTQTVCDGLAGMIHGLLALGTQTVDGAGIAVVFTEVRKHRIYDLRCRFGSCCII